MPSMDHPWMASHLVLTLCLRIRGCQSYCAIHRPSMDGQSPCPHPLSKYPWMPELLCHPWTIHGWPATFPSPLCLSIRGCQSYCAIHGPSMDGQSPCLPHLCLSIRGCQSYCAVHGPSMDGQSPCPHPLSKYPWMPELLCRPWTIRGWLATLPSPLCLSIHGCQSYCAIHGPSMDGQSPCPHPLSKYLWMPQLLCHPWTIHGWPATLSSPSV